MKWLARFFWMRRWALSPFQMYDLMFLLAAAITQVALGATPGSVQADLQRETLLAMAACNIVGGTIALVGLHMRELETGLWVEFWGYLCLIFVLGTFIWLVAAHELNPNASTGFSLAEAFVYAAIHRSIQILLYKRARRQSRRLEHQANLLQEVLAMPPSRKGDER